jgi:hypothetical protein
MPKALKNRVTSHDTCGLNLYWRVGFSGLRQQHKAYSDKLAKSVAILQCYVAYIYSAPGPDLPAVAEP